MPKLTMYFITFRDYGGQSYYLHTTDPEKIGPWLAEMYGLFPYTVSAVPKVDIVTSAFR